jgi:hypothetical protein
MKFYESGRYALFDISQDIAEQRDLAEQMPGKVRALDQLLVQYLSTVNAQMAVPNPDYDPMKEPSDRKGKGGSKMKKKSGKKAGKGRA